MVRKGQKKRVWTPEQKLEIIQKYLQDHISLRTLEREYNTERSMISHWVYSLLYNGSCIGLSVVLCLVVDAIVCKPLGKFLVK